MNQIEFIVEGKPVPYIRTTQKQKFYCKQWMRYQAYKNLVQISYKKPKELENTQGPYVIVTIKYYDPTPESNNFYDYVGDLELDIKIYNYRRADVVNIAKGIEDALNKVAYYDDRQVVRISAEYTEYLKKKGEKNEIINGIVRANRKTSKSTKPALFECKPPTTSTKGRKTN